MFFLIQNNITPLHVASKWGNQGVAERLITAGAELDCRTRDGLTPLHCAARSGHDTVVQLLLSAGAHISAKTRVRFKIIFNGVFMQFVFLIQMFVVQDFFAEKRNHF